jgi:DNA-binding GntR family transcriptional regulator
MVKEASSVSLASAEPRSLGDAAYQQLRSDIVSCRLAPGQRLTERALAETTGYGISPVRDALTRLDHEGLVRTLPRKGYQVTPLTLKAIDDLFTLWGIVGPEIARLGIRDATAVQRKQLVEIFKEMRKLGEATDNIEGDNRLRLIELADTAFSALAAATQNDYLITIYQRLQNDMARIGVLIMQGDAPLVALAVDEQLLELVERRDTETIAESVRAMAAEMHSQAIRIFSRWPSVTATEITLLQP